MRVGAAEALPPHCLRDLAHGRLVMVKPVMLAKQIAPRLRHVRPQGQKRISEILRRRGLRASSLRALFLAHVLDDHNVNVTD